MREQDRRALDKFSESLNRNATRLDGIQEQLHNLHYMAKECVEHLRLLRREKRMAAHGHQRA